MKFNLICPTQNRMKKNEWNVYSFWIFAPNIHNFATTELSPTFSPTSKRRVPTTKPIELQTMWKFGKMLIEIMPKTVMAISTRFTSCRRRAKFLKLLPCRQIWYDIFNIFAILMKLQLFYIISMRLVSLTESIWPKNG